MNKTITPLLFAIASFMSVSAMAQQMGLNTQYMFNQMTVNPAAAGSQNYVPVQLNFRKQWVSFPNSPTSQYLSAHGYVGSNFGLGGMLYNEVSGPSRITGLALNTAYQMQLSSDNNHRLAMGMGITLAQHIIDETQLTTYLPDDPSIVRGFNNVLVPDATIGVFYKYKDKAYAGLSARNLVQMKRDLYNFENILYNPMVRTYYLVGGYKFKLSEKFDLKAATLIQGIETGTVQGDISAIGIYSNSIWLGASYRHTDAVAFLAGFQLGVVKVGYSYDYTLSDVGNYSQGSHEILLELQLTSKDKTERTPWLKRNRIYSPGI